jgi:3-carboxy-cis,cis-muconate cycloisomerase
MTDPITSSILRLPLPDESRMTFSNGTGLTGALFVDPEMAEILSDRRWLEAMLDFEAALARAEAEVGVIPKEAAEIIASCCEADLYDIAEIGRRTTLAGNPAIPLVAMLTDKVREKDATAAEFVHYGATSQDVIDTGLSVITGDALHRIRNRVQEASTKLAALVIRHRSTPAPGRTLLQHALPIPFGLKCALWLDALIECEKEIAVRANIRFQFGGAAGTLASLGANGKAASEKMAQSGHQFERPDRQHRGFATRKVPWHTSRSDVQFIATSLGILASTLGKIARDIALLMQTEVAEVFEPSAPGKGGSSTLPHKRNPVHTTAIIAIAHRTPGLVATMLSAGMQEHERGVGGWHAEWDTMRDLLALTGAAALHMQTLLEGLEVDTDRMRQNLEMTNGLIMAERLTFALAPSLGKTKAKSFMEAACKRAVAEKRHLKLVLEETPEAAALDLDALFDPTTYLGASDVFIDRILALYENEKRYMVEEQQRPSS